MTDYFHVDVSHVSRGNWRGYIQEHDYFIEASSQPALEYEAYRVVEQISGNHAFRLIFSES